MRPHAAFRHLTWLLPLLVVAVGAFLRLYRLGEIPPAFNFDEAAHATDAMEILAGHHFIFSPKIGGVEALFMYATAGMFALLGPEPLSQRLIAALIGIATVAAAYFMVRTMFADEEEPARTRLAVLASLGLATSFWHVNYSRIGLEVNMTPFFAVLSFWSLWQGLRSGRTWDFVLSGASMGAAAYGHLPGRFLPFPVVAFFALMWVSSMRRETRALSPGAWGETANAHVPGPRLLSLWPLAIVAVAALVVFAPLGYHFATHPADFFGRASSTSIFNPALNHGDFWGTLWRSAAGTFGAFGFTSDRVWIANLPGKSILNPALAVLFWLGVVIAVGRAIGRPLASGTRLGSGAPYVFVLAWWILLLVPAIISPERTPHFSRMMSVAPVAYVFPAIALVALSVELAAVLHPMRTLWFSIVDPELRFAIGYPDSSPGWQRLLQRRLRSLAYLALAALFAWTAVETYRDYFDDWAVSPAHYMAFDGYAIELVKQMEADSDPLSVYVIPRDVRAGEFYQHYTIDFMHRRGAPYHYLPMREAEVPAMLTEALRGKQVVHLVKWKMDKHREADPKDYVAWLLEVYSRPIGSRSFDAYDVVTYRLPSADVDFTQRARESGEATNGDLAGGTIFGGQIALDSAAFGNASSPAFVAEHEAPSGGLIWVAPVWRAVAGAGRDYRASIILEDAAGHVMAHVDRDLIHGWHMRTSGWPVGELVGDYYLLPVPPGSLPGDYRVLAAVYDAETLQRLPVDAAGRTSVLLGEIGVIPTTGENVTLPGPRHEIDAPLPEPSGLVLQGIDLDLERAHAPGEQLTIAALWRKARADDLDVSVEIVLSSGDVDLILMPAQRVAGDTYPTDRWAPDEAYRSLYDLSIPAEVPSGSYRLRLRAYAPQRGLLETLELGRLTIEGRVRSFDSPRVENPLRENFGGVARLLGYDVSAVEARPGGKLAVTLYWQALGQTATSYTVFLHLLDDGNLVRAQRDAQPMNGEAPTTGWLPGEIIADRIELPLDTSLPAGLYQFEVGLYDPITGVRLKVGSEDRVLLGAVHVD